MTSKLQQIKSYLATGRSLTPAEAIINGFGFRLAARVLDLRRQGVPVVTEIRENPATGDKYAAYRLPKVGDRVRIINEGAESVSRCYPTHYYRVGDTGTLTEVAADLEGSTHQVRFDTLRNGDFTWYVSRGDIEVLQ